MQKVTLVKKVPLAKDVYGFYFEKGDITFVPGQFLTMHLKVNGKDDTRDFSIASAPWEKELLIATSKGVSDYKRTLFSLPKGFEIQIENPAGGFVLQRDVNSIHNVFLAGGIGITPFRSILMEVVKQASNVPITLVASFSQKEDMLFYNELSQITPHMGNIHIVYTLSREASQWGGEKGRISEDLLKKYISNLSHAVFYVAGKTDMVDAMQELLQRLGVEGDKIKIDYFTGY